MDTPSPWRSRMPDPRMLRQRVLSLSFLERAFVVVLTLVLIGSALSFIGILNRSLSTITPGYGGAITEGIVGTPRFINPLLAQSNADQELTVLVYSGLMRALPSGELVPDLAQGFDVDEEGMTYTFTLRDDAVFHDGVPVTAEDVVYTINLIQDPRIQSPRQPTWEGISVRANDARSVQFVLPRPYASFLENMTLGVLPKHVWENVRPEEFAAHLLNTEPVGTGPFRVGSVDRDASGIPTLYTLNAFKESTRGRPFLDTIRVRIFGNEADLIEAFTSGDIDGFDSLDAADAASLQKSGVRILSYELPRIFGIFFNQNHNDTLTDSAVRRALDMVVDKERIVSEVLYGFGEAAHGPLPSFLYAEDTASIDALSDESDTAATDRLARAQTILEDAGWTKNTETGIYEKKEVPLSISIATANTDELRKVAELVQKEWQRLGVDTTVALFDIGQLHNEIIRPREYDALLFGQVVGRDGDIYPFWHSSQRNDPGLNVALYTSIEADDILDDVRTTLDPETRRTLYRSFIDIVREDVPAVFLYMPHLLYVAPEDVHGIETGVVRTSAERFLDVDRWHLYTEHVWNIFASENR